MLYISNMKLEICNIKLEINNEVKKLNKNTRTWKRALFALGISLCITAALLMVNGSIFGDRTVGIAIVTGIIGIGLISTSNTTLGPKNAKESKKVIA